MKRKEKIFLIKNKALKSQLKTAINKLDELAKTQEDTEQYIRRECIEIRGIPHTDRENTNEIAIAVANMIHVDIKDEDISVSHRLNSNANYKENL